jgi:hypothetical protein
LALEETDSGRLDDPHAITYCNLNRKKSSLTLQSVITRRGPARG